MKYINFHRKTGITPSIGIHLHSFGTSKVLIIRMWWAALTFRTKWPAKKKKAYAANIAELFDKESGFCGAYGK